MAAVSLSPTPHVPSTAAMSSSMSSRRVPLSVNSNAANSPLRTGNGSVNGSGTASNSLTAALYAKQHQQRRSHASIQREDSYGQAPPAKKQMVEKAEHHVSATVTNARVSGLRSPTLSRRVPQVQRTSTSTRAYHQAERVSSQQQQQQSHHHQQQLQQSHHRRQEYQKISEREAEEVRRWQESQRLRFPKLVFYFDNLPEDQSVRLSKQVNHLGAREDKFFSIDITHVVTTRTIPPEEKPAPKQQQQALRTKEANAEHVSEASHEHVQTINPSLLSRSHVNELGITTTSLPVKRKLFDTAPGRRMPLTPFGAVEDAIRKPKPTRSTDILQRAREMGKKIWSLEKLQKVLDMLLEPDPYRSAELGQRMRNGSTTNGAAVSQQGNSRFTGDQALLQMLDKERHTGPSDRDPTVATRELIYFKGYYLYVYDIEEKQRPIMVREYAKVADREEGDWPQLRPSADARCPFIEDTDQLELRAEKKRARMRSTATNSRDAAVAGTAASTGVSMHKTLVSRYAATAHGSVAAKQATGKRTLTEMEDGHNRQMTSTGTNAMGGAPSIRPAEGVFGGSNAAASAGSMSSVASANPPSKAIATSRAGSAEYQAQQAFTSRSKAGRYFAGEPVASGMQAAGITSAIRSQMISSATGTLGARAGTSKEIHGLQRKVLQKSTAVATTSTSQQHDHSSRRMTDSVGTDQQQQQAQQPHRHGYSRSTSVATGTVVAAQLSAKLNQALDGSATSADDRQKRRTVSAPVVAQVPRAKKRDPKPGYCENCQDKFDDFEVHIGTHKHRKFAEDERNWTDLDQLLSQLTRQTKYGLDEWQ